MRVDGAAIDTFVLQLSDLPAPTGDGPDESSSTPDNIFVESHGQVVVEAEHFSSRTTAGEMNWVVVPEEDRGVGDHSNFRGTGYVQVLPDRGATGSISRIAQTREEGLRQDVQRWTSSVAAETDELRSNVTPTLWLLLARAHFELGQNEQARRWYNQATHWGEQNEPSKVHTEQLRRLRAEVGPLIAVIKGEVIVPVGSRWKWLHPTDGTDPATTDTDFHATFFKADYDDSHWKTGKDSPGPDGGFGYGDPVGVDIGTPRRPNRKTAYFRHTFRSDAAFEHLVISMQRDDGVIVYLDGKEVGRDNIGPGQEGYDLYAEGFIPPSGWLVRFNLPLFPHNRPGETLVRRISLSGTIGPGEHVLAISLHNRPGGSSDLRIAEISLWVGRIGFEALPPDDPRVITDDEPGTK